jgi:SAM-dependent methyltransferase
VTKAAATKAAFPPPDPAATITIATGGRGAVSLPWWLRIALKLLLARLPLPYAWWRRLGIFRHGSLADDVERRGAAFLTHLDHYRRVCGRPLRRLVEIGPGDSVAGALWAKACGAEQIWLIDAGRYAVDDPAHYRAACARIAAYGLSAPSVAPPGGIAAVLAAAGAVYRTDGLAALASLPDGSIDLLFSQAVLEHIPRRQFDDFLRQCFRVLRPGGLCSHGIDLQDHLGGALNHLRFAERLWEHPAFARSGFYTNRLRCGEICGRAGAAGFSVSIAQLVRWAKLPTRRAALHPSFRCLPDEELCVASFTLILQKPLRPAGS